MLARSNRRMEDDHPLLQHLQKLSAPPPPEESLAQVLETLWSTRKSGLSPHQKTVIQSLLNLSALEYLGPILACLRSIIRKTVNDNLIGDDIQSLLPVELSVELERTLLVLLQKYQNQWKEEASKDQTLWQRMRVPNQVKVTALPSLTSCPASELSSRMWPQKEDTTFNYNCSNLGDHTTVAANFSHSSSAPMSLQHDNGSLNNSTSFPNLKSMTWTLENQNSIPANRIAIISLKLQDYKNPSSGEIEVKFQLSRDTLEAMLRSTTYISDQLPESVRTYTVSLEFLLTGCSCSSAITKKAKAMTGSKHLHTCLYYIVSIRKIFPCDIDVPLTAVILPFKHGVFVCISWAFKIAASIPCVTLMHLSLAKNCFFFSLMTQEP